MHVESVLNLHDNCYFVISLFLYLSSGCNMYDDRILLWFFMCTFFYCLWPNPHWFYESVLHVIKVCSSPPFDFFLVHMVKL